MSDIEKEIAALRDEIAATANRWKKKIADLCGKAEKKPGETFVWAIGKKNSNALCLAEPVFDAQEGEWLVGTLNVKIDLGLKLGEARKYRLVPADQPNIPWRYSVEEETRTDKFKALVIFKDGSFGEWEGCVQLSGQWGFQGVVPKHILCYCPLDELPGSGSDDAV